MLSVDLIEAARLAESVRDQLHRIDLRSCDRQTRVDLKRARALAAAIVLTVDAAVAAAEA